MAHARLLSTTPLPSLCSLWYVTAMMLPPSGARRRMSAVTECCARSTGHDQ